jgi:Fuc2NAc and GlcNAc transferase
VTSGGDWAIVVALATAVAWVCVWLVRRQALRIGLIDEPNQRSSHRKPTPNGGGIGIVLGAGSGLAVASLLGGTLPGGAWTVFAAATAVAVVGLVDDFVRLPPVIRFLTQASAAAVVVRILGPFEALPLPAPLNLDLPAAVLGWGLALLWITALTNFFNFMDGMDGLAGGQAAASCLGVLVAGWSSDASVLVACAGAASLGFLIHNWSPARVFMGDVGSVFLGFLIASLPFLAPMERRGDAVVAIAVGLALFLLDPLETLLRRAVAGKRLIGAHREHAYQQFLNPGDAAGTVAGALVVAGLGLGLLGAMAFRRPNLGWIALGVATLTYVGERYMAKRSSRLRGERVQAPHVGFDRG